MKYLVNRETKEHKAATPLAESIIKGYPDFKDDWQLVEADPEGWIPWSGGECPLPDDCKVAIILDERICDQDRAGDWGWLDYSLTAYRPILSETAEKVENYTAGLPHSAFWKTEQSVFDRLKSAIAASESIPGIIAEIDAMLPEGYCVARRESEQPAKDMSDWRNWIEGDFLRVVKEENGHGFPIGSVVQIKATGTGGVGSKEFLCKLDASDWYLLADEVGFHSRPAKVTE